MPTYDARLAALEKNITVMQQGVVYKLDDTVAALKGVVEVQGRDSKYLTNQVKSNEIRLEGLIEVVRAFQEQLQVQGQSIRDTKRRLDGIDERFTSLDEKLDDRFDQALHIITSLTDKGD